MTSHDLALGLEKYGPAIAISALTAWLTVKFAFARFRNERSWERRAAAYDKVIEAFALIKNAASAWEDESMGASRLSEQTNKELNDKWNHAQQELQRSIAIGSYLLPSAAIEVLTKFRQTKFGNPREDPPFELFAAEASAAKHAIEALTQIARKDLKLSH
jgi:hypothetical protein